MKLTRRDALKLGIALPFASACLSQRPEARLLSSRAPLPGHSKSRSRAPPFWRPSAPTAQRDYHEITVHPARGEDPARAYYADLGLQRNLPRPHYRSPRRPLGISPSAQ